MVGKPFEATAFFILPQCSPPNLEQKAKYALEGMGFEILRSFSGPARTKVVGVIGSPGWDRLLRIVFRSDVGCRCEASVVCKKEILGEQERWVLGLRAAPYKTRIKWGRGLVSLRQEILERLVHTGVLNPVKHRRIKVKKRYFFT